MNLKRIGDHGHQSIRLFAIFPLFSSRTNTYCVLPFLSKTVSVTIGDIYGRIFKKINNAKKRE